MEALRRLAQVNSGLEAPLAAPHLPEIAPHDVTAGGSLTASLAAMERAKRTLEDFVRFNFAFHSLDCGNPAHVFKHLPLLMLVEANIYALDDANELAAADTAGMAMAPSAADLDIDGGGGRATPPGACRACGAKASLECADARATAHDGPRPVHVGATAASLAPLRGLLSARGLLTPHVERSLAEGLEFWGLERKLCGALMLGGTISEADALRASSLKSFDYRLLDALLYALEVVMPPGCVLANRRSGQ